MPLRVEIGGAEMIARRLAVMAQAAEGRLRARLLAAAGETADAAAARVRDQRDPARPLPSRLAGSLVIEEAGAAIRVAATAPHAVFVELGTARAAAEPFLGPAFEDATARLAADLPRRGGGA